ncbi:hypothetical protein KSP39_PZI022402 [Platanthera zijinensis]|uniref:Transposase n=1 Tax=Platanthera zijinensis TaxID=2320716 RepID=A0AAP0AUT3_9ASPA
MRKVVAEWVLMHEISFSMVEDEGFNRMMRCAQPLWERISRFKVKKDCVTIYNNEKAKLKRLLDATSKMSLTTDLWKSKNQKMEYMVITVHFIDSTWKLQKRVLSFVHVPPPRRGIDICNAIYNCLMGWGVEHKIMSISMDNASANDVAMQHLKRNFSRTRKLLCGGKIFHVRCCAHILNLMVQDGLGQIKEVIQNVRESVLYINASDARLIDFSKIVKTLSLPTRKLILDCKTRWNSTYQMLSTAVVLKNAFSMYSDMDDHFNTCPTQEEWEKVELVCEILGVFNRTTNLISGSDYPTANLFLPEIYGIKIILDRQVSDDRAFVRDMTLKMKLKFDKYWGDCNMLMSIASVLDPRWKMRAIEFSFPKIYTNNEATQNIAKVRSILVEIYAEYESMQSEIVDEANFSTVNPSEGASSSNVPSSSLNSTALGFHEICEYVRTVETIPPPKSELDLYIEETCLMLDRATSSSFDALVWWKENSMKYRILSKMARDILAIPITTVASEATFSAGSRIIDTYRASLAPETVQILICGGDWTRSTYGVKKKFKVNNLFIAYFSMLFCHNLLMHDIHLLII